MTLVLLANLSFEPQIWHEKSWTALAASTEAGFRSRIIPQRFDVRFCFWSKNSTIIRAEEVRYRKICNKDFRRRVIEIDKNSILRVSRALSAIYPPPEPVSCTILVLRTENNILKAHRSNLRLGTSSWHNTHRASRAQSGLRSGTTPKHLLINSQMK